MNDNFVDLFKINLKRIYKYILSFLFYIPRLNEQDKINIKTYKKKIKIIFYYILN